MNSKHIVLLRSAPVAGVQRTKGWSGPAPAAEADDLISRGWAAAADRTKARGGVRDATSGSGKRR